MELSAVRAGVRSGAPLLAVVFACQLVLVVASDDPNDAWAIVLLALLLWAFARAGRVAAVRSSQRPLRSAALGGLAVFGLWIPLRLVVAVAGDSDNPLAGLGAAAALAVFVGLAAGLLAGRRDQTGETRETR